VARKKCDTFPTPFLEEREKEAKDKKMREEREKESRHTEVVLYPNK
jgi:hypothetical protein